MKKYIQDFEILSNERLNEGYYLLKLKSYEDLPTILPAQFVEVKVENSATAFLRRPISIHDVDYENNTISLLIRIAGRETENLSHIKAGSQLNIIYPLGNSFSVPTDSNVLLIGGGCGVAPMLYAAKYFLDFGIQSTMLFGYRSRADVLRHKEYEKYGKVFYTTEDGSCGEKGNVLNHYLLSANEYKFDKIYACGPEPMLKAVANWSIQNNIDCEVSLENMMACGIGACLCCVQNTTEGHKCICNEGPVFNAKNIIW